MMRALAAARPRWESWVTEWLSRPVCHPRPDAAVLPSPPEIGEGQAVGLISALFLHGLHTTDVAADLASVIYARAAEATEI